MEDWLGVIAILVVCGSVGALVMWLIHLGKRARAEGIDEAERAYSPLPPTGSDNPRQP